MRWRVVAFGLAFVALLAYELTYATGRLGQRPSTLLTCNADPPTATVADGNTCYIGSPFKKYVRIGGDWIPDEAALIGPQGTTGPSGPGGPSGVTGSLVTTDPLGTLSVTSGLKYDAVSGVQVPGLASLIDSINVPLDIAVDGTTYASLASTGWTLPVAGQKHFIKEGTNACMGRATILDTASSILVETTCVTAASEIMLTGQDGEVSPWVSARTAAADFTITRTGTAGARAVGWIIFEPAP